MDAATPAAWGRISSRVVLALVGVAAGLPSGGTRRRSVRPNISGGSEEIMHPWASVTGCLGKIVAGTDDIGHHPLVELVNVAGYGIVADFAPMAQNHHSIAHLVDIF
jgi:hypothetical protein